MGFLGFTILFFSLSESFHVLYVFFYTTKRFKEFSSVIWSVYIIQKLLLDVIFTSVHVFVLRSITKTLTESGNFLRSLNPTDNIKKRLKAISDILKFNKVLLFLQVLVPLFEVIKLSFSFAVGAGLCSNCDLGKLAVGEFIVNEIQNALGAVQSIVFALIHFRFMRIFSCKRNNDGTNDE